MTDETTENKGVKPREARTGEAMPERGSGKPRTRVYGMIGQRLRDFFDGVANQPVPDRFEELLQKLDERNKPERDE